MGTQNITYLHNGNDGNGDDDDDGGGGGGGDSSSNARISGTLLKRVFFRSVVAEVNVMVVFARVRERKRRR